MHWPFVLCANLSTMFREVPFLDRFHAARMAGFTAVEMQYPYEWDKYDLASRLDGEGLRLALFNVPAGDRTKGGPGYAGLRGREAEFRDNFMRALDYAGSLKPAFLHVLSGVPAARDERMQVEDCLTENLLWAVAQIEDTALGLLLEAINPIDIPGYALGSQAEVARMLRRIDRSAVRMLFDAYHAAQAGEPVIETLLAMMDLVGHVQISSPPGRSEPEQGKVDFAALFECLRRARYGGWVGCEYVPRAGTDEGLAWLNRYGLSSALGAQHQV